MPLNSYLSVPKPHCVPRLTHMQVRFDFEGFVVPPDADLPTHLGLHHHAEQQAMPGYTLSGQSARLVPNAHCWHLH